MTVSHDDDEMVEGRGARARTHRLMLETAIALMQEGQTPSVTEVAAAAGVSRATAYRYFPSQVDLVDAVVAEALGPILEWTSDSDNAESRVEELLASSLPRIFEFEAPFRAALKLSLEQWAQRQAGILDEASALRRGHRVDLLPTAIAPLRKTLPRKQFQRLAQALSLVYGLESVVILKDLWGLGERDVQSVSQWAARVLVKAAIAEAKAAKRQRDKVRTSKSK